MKKLTISLAMIFSLLFTNVSYAASASDVAKGVAKVGACTVGAGLLGLASAFTLGSAAGIAAAGDAMRTVDNPWLAIFFLAPLITVGTGLALAQYGGLIGAALGLGYCSYSVLTAAE